MRRSIHPAIPMRAALAALLTLVVAATTTPAAIAATPNESILLYRPGTARTGVLSDTQFVRKGTFAMSGITGAAASRSSLALYNKATGKLRTGTFRGGVFTPVETVTIRTGFTHLAASCDSLMLYSSVSGRILTGTLIGGRFRNRSTRLIAPGWISVAASCDTAWFVKTVNSDMSVHELGVLVGGDYTKQQDDTDGPRTETAMTDTSWIALKGNGLGDWGPVADGKRDFFGDHLDSFFPGQRMAGTATHVLFYTPETASSCIWRLVGREWSQSPCGQVLPSGLTVMAGVGGRAVGGVMVRVQYESSVRQARAIGPADLEEPRWVRALFASTWAAWPWLVVRLYVASVFLPAGWGKVTSGQWLLGDGAPIRGMLAAAVSAPDTPPWYASFLESVVAPHAGLFATLVAVGELTVGVTLLLGGLTGLFAFGGVFLNANFVLAGALGPNPVLIVLGTLLVLAWRNAGWVGLDRWLLPAGSRLLGRREAARPERSRAGDRRWR